MAQNRAYFVSTDYIFNTYAGYLDNNIDPNSIKTFILIAENEQLQQLIGYTLFTKYIQIITDGTISTDSSLSNYKYLLDNFLVDSVSLWTIWYALDAIHFRPTNKSVVTKSSPPNSSASDTGLYRLKNILEGRAQFIDTRTRYYILNNPSFFPEYYQVTTAYQLMPKTVTYDNSGNLALLSGLGGAGAWGSYGLGGGGGGCCGGYVPGTGIPIWGT